MNFVIDKISKSSGRLGYLVQAETGKRLQTPILLHTTKAGSIPYLTPDVFEGIVKDAQILQISLATIERMAQSFQLYKGSFSSYVGLKEQPTMLMVRDPCELMPSGLNVKGSVPLYTKRGKILLTVQDYMELVETFAPAIYQGLCDADCNNESSKKRVQKSADRTEEFMDYCYEHHSKSEKLKCALLLAPIVGGFSKYARLQCIKHAKTKGGGKYGGYIFEGLHNYGHSATALLRDQVSELMSVCLNELEVDKLRAMPGALTPPVVLDMISLGVDMFDTSYAYVASTGYKALTFNLDLAVELKSGEQVAPLLDLTDNKLEEQFQPFVEGCLCMACTNHTRAYVHHLYRTGELLGPILLMTHNLHYYMKFFEVIRSCVSNDSLPQLVDHINAQCSENSYCIPLDSADRRKKHTP